MTAAARIDRAKVLVGSRSGLSNPVIFGFAAQGLTLTLGYARLVMPNQLQSFAAAACSIAASCGLLLLVRRIATPAWSRPRPALVLGSLAAASIIRSIMSVALISGLPTALSLPDGALGRTIAAVSIAMAVCVGLGAIVQLGRERGALLAEVLAEQSRLRNLARTMEHDLEQAEADLRVRARALLEPTIAEIRYMLDGELSPAEAAQVAARISQSVDVVVRPVSRELAVSPAVTLASIGPLRPEPLNLLHDRMDVPGAIRPTWVLLLTWVTLLPGPLLVLRAGVVMLSAVWASLVFWLLLQAARRAWPPRWRSMPILPGLGLLLAVYLIGNLAFQVAVTRTGTSSPGDWATMTTSGMIVRVALAMLVVVVAMIDEHSRRTRARLAELNEELEELIARLRRQTWLLHRSVALAVHGPVQSALVSTAMRLASADRTHASVIDARRRLDEALSGLMRDRHDDVSIEGALDDLCGLWQGIVRIDVDVDEATRARLAADASLRRCVIEVCRESASNAIRHGQARTVTIALVESAGRIEVRVTDDGTGLAAALNPGLGMAMLDDTCLRWSLRDAQGGGAELIATVV